MVILLVRLQYGELSGFELQTLKRNFLANTGTLGNINKSQT